MSELEFDKASLSESEPLGGPIFDIALLPQGDRGSSFRTQNDPSAPYQRQNYIERQGSIDIRCSCLDVIHGRLSATGSELATLIVLQFRFDVRKKARRIESVDISLEFKGTRASEACPEVYAIKPLDRMFERPTTQEEEVKHNAKLELGGSGPVGGITLTGSLGRETTVKRRTEDFTIVTGSIDLKGRNWGKPNCASWTLLENSSTKTGVPVSMRTAILLRREDDSEFHCVVKIDAKVDVKSRIERLFGQKKDDPVLFEPSIKPTNRLQEYDIDNLGAVDLSSLCDVTMVTTLSGAILRKRLDGQSEDELQRSNSLDE